MSSLTVSRVTPTGLVLLGSIDRETRGFSYDKGYLARPDAAAISLALPLHAEPFSVLATSAWFGGLLPEYEALDTLAATLQADSRDWLAILSAVGDECIGDLFFGDPSRFDPGAYEPVPAQTIAEALDSPRAASQFNEGTRLSLAGTQTKIGAAHRPSCDMDEGWLRPLSGAASTHVLKTSALDGVCQLEWLCMGMASRVGIEAARTDLLAGSGPILVSERFDRAVADKSDGLGMTRLHQEDLAQALGLSHSEKYDELPGGTVHAVARLLLRHSAAPALDLRRFAQLLLFHYLVGNCDAHLKNYALLTAPGTRAPRLAPAYDIVSTTVYERFSTRMAMKLGAASDINEVTPQDVVLMADAVGLPRKTVATLARELPARARQTLHDLQARCGDESVVYWGDRLDEDMTPRMDVLEAVRA